MIDFKSEEIREFITFGKGEAGGKAEGLKRLLEMTPLIIKNSFSTIETGIPPFTVILTRYFDQFIEENRLHEIIMLDIPDERKARKFIEAELPCELSGYLWKITEMCNYPLAVRSSSMLEDMKNNPLAGVFATQMVPNNQLNISERFKSLTDAVKLIYSSTYSKKAISYMKANGLTPEEEKMAVIIQRVAGTEKNGCYYPDLSGVAKSWNYYPGTGTSPSDGIVQLALGLGKTIVDGEPSWQYSPEAPCIPPPFNSNKDMLNSTQRKFWAINMRPQTEYIPFKEDSYLIEKQLQDAEYDNRLKYTASTWDPSCDIIRPGTGTPGPRLINFKPILDTGLIPLNDSINSIMEISENSLNDKVELEFAMRADYTKEKKHKLSLLQVRPMNISNNNKIDMDLAPDKSILLSSSSILGNGVIDSINHIVYVKPDTFDFKHTPAILKDLEKINRNMVSEQTPYLLIGFGRWGSSDPWLGLPVDWEHISGAKAIVEVKDSNRPTEFSQGSHFFHNLTNLKIVYFSVDHKDQHPINWKWLESRHTAIDTEFVKLVKTEEPVTIAVDGNIGKGAIFIT